MRGLEVGRLCSLSPQTATCLAARELFVAVRILLTLPIANSKKEFDSI